MKKVSFAQRLRQALEMRNMKQITLSKKSGVSRALISAYLKGDYEAKQDKIFLLAKALDVNETWLMGYEDISAERSDEIKSEDLLMEAASDFLLGNSNKHNDLMKKIALLDDKDLIVVENLVDSLLKIKD
ncbi:helix-turn-helix transcriptional regulator [Enterococcus sp. BWB1-3]|uniref:helix-turn-helix domain-containing protein n=1 Tax=unclassified Enterococcus TaxID=2608891 RepID=UPI001923FD17|nr:MULTISPECIES: helix-turn-helix transcriptional regulator [unclassified Enterococcus]MBL1227999.1 helix-turn-helix transcriptional regulator [Enterococcus sp. BWB1-3]MCB5951839.1 helix-turn-helix domain-containing protein [Enterococcus sp. BWT-B8]MCB5954036.1 helix-turn-helix domain-containing protein [Enterococcus sp. CWB-B31]